MSVRSLTYENLAYPATDTVVRELFLDAPSVESEVACKNYLRSFLRSLFDTVREQAEEFFSTFGTQSYLLLAAMFHELFTDTSRRNYFYTLVATKWTSNKKATAADIRRSFDEAKNVLMRCSDWPVSGSCPIIISMDEVHVLHATRTKDNMSPLTLYSRFKSVMSEIVEYAVCLLVLSTASNISGLAPSKNAADSLCEQATNSILPAPFTELQFDAHIIADPLVPGKATLDSVGSLEFTAKFGRPL